MYIKPPENNVYKFVLSTFTRMVSYTYKVVKYNKLKIFKALSVKYMVFISY